MSGGVSISNHSCCSMAVLGKLCQAALAGSVVPTLDANHGSTVPVGVTLGRLLSVCFGVSMCKTDTVKVHIS